MGDERKAHVAVMADARPQLSSGRARIMSGLANRIAAAVVAIQPELNAMAETEIGGETEKKAEATIVNKLRTNPLVNVKLISWGDLTNGEAKDGGSECGVGDIAGTVGQRKNVEHANAA